jgi:hypothetical protein
MSLTLEQRVAILEREIAELKAQHANGSQEKPWLRSLGMFKDDEGMKGIFEEAMRIREKDRERARRRYAKKPSRSRASK